VLNTSACGVPNPRGAATSAFMIGVTRRRVVFIYYARGDVVLPVAAAVALGALPAAWPGPGWPARGGARAGRS